MSVSAPSASGRPTLDSPYSAETGATASSSSSSSRCCSGDSSKPDSQPQDSLSCSEKRIPLIDYIHNIMLEVLLQQQLSPDELAADAAHCAALAAATGNAAAGNNGGDTDNLRLMTLQLMSAECLLTHQNLYLWLNEQLYGLPICTQTVKNVNTTKNTSHKGIAYLEPTPPSGIYHTFKPETYPHPEAAAAARRPDGRISCVDHLKARYNATVQYPELPCIAVQLSGKACRGKPLREQFIHYPLEMCSVELPDAGSPFGLKRLASYKWTVLQTICSIGSPHYKAAIPPWVAETLNDHYIRVTAAAPTAAAQDGTAAVRSGIDVGVSTAHNRPAPEAVPSESADQPQAAAATVMPPGANWPLTGEQNPQAVQSVAQERIVENLQGLQVSSVNSSSEGSGRCAGEPCSNTTTRGGSCSAPTSIAVAAAADKACSLAPYSACTEMNAPSSADVDDTIVVITKTVTATVPTPSDACNTAAAATVTPCTGHPGSSTAGSSANAGCITAEGSNSSSSSSAGSSNFVLSGASCTAASSASAHSSVSMPGSNPPDLHSKLQVFINPLTDALSKTSAGTSSAAMAAADAAAAGQVALSIGPQSQQQQQKFAVAPSTSIAAAVAESPAATPCQQYCSAAVTVGHAPATAAAAGSMSSAAFHTGIEAVVPQGMKTATTSSAEAAVAAATPTGQLTATVPAAERSSSAPAARAAAELASPANNNLGLRSSLQATASGEPSSSSSSSSSSIDSRNMPDHNSNDPIDVPSSVQEGFSQLLSNLYPSDQRQQQMKRALNTVCGAVRCASNRQKSVNWVVAQIVKAGSFVKKTSLAGTSDLDIVIKLIPCQTPYQKCRCELLDAVAAYMCRPADSSNAARPDRGWQLQPCHSHHYVKLHHPELELYLDIQVAEHFGDKHQQKEALLGWLLQTAAQREAILAGQATEADFSDSLPGSGALLENEQLLLRLSERCGVSRERVTNLTELTTEVVTGVDQRMIQQHEVHGMGRLCTDIIRALKAWSKFGLPKALEAEAASTSRNSVAAARSGPQKECFHGPPGYIWEIFVVHVLEQAIKDGTDRLKRYDQSRPLQLFKDVLKAASTSLRSTAEKSEAIIIPLHYSKQQALMKVFRDKWGPEGVLSSPFIINPVDPSYNCTKHAAFRSYDVLAAAVGELLQRINQAQHSGAGGWSWLCETSTLGSVAKEFKVVY